VRSRYDNSKTVLGAEAEAKTMTSLFTLLSALEDSCAVQELSQEQEDRLAPHRLCGYIDFGASWLPSPDGSLCDLLE